MYQVKIQDQRRTKRKSVYQARITMPRTDRESVLENEMNSHAIIHRKAINMDRPYPNMSDAENIAHNALIEYIANQCINNNQYRVGNEFHYLDVPNLNRMFFRAMPCLRLMEAYCFLDENGGNEGMIRLILKDGCNPKYSFWVNEKGDIEYCHA